MNAGSGGSGGSAALYGERVYVSGGGGVQAIDTSGWTSNRSYIGIYLDSLVFNGGAPQDFSLKRVSANANVVAQIGTLEITAGTTVNATFDWTSADATDGVNFGTILLNGNAGGGATLGITIANSGAYAFDTLSATGKNNSLTGEAINATGKNLAFDLADLSSGETSVTSASAVTITNAAVTLSNVAPGFDLGERVTLIDNTTGAATTTQTSATFGGVTYGFAVGGTNSLDLFMNEIQTAGDYTVNGPKEYKAGAFSNESVTLDVGGTLTVVGGGLIMTANNVLSAATLKAGTLKADALTLDGPNAKAAIGVYDVTNADSVLTLNNTAAANVVIGAINIGAGHKFTVGGTGSYRANTLNVLGVGATFDGNLNATGMTLNFAIADPLKQGDTMLAVTGSADLTGATIVLAAATPLTTLYAGNDFNLVAATGTLTATSFDGTTQQDVLGNTYSLSVDGNTLVATFNKSGPVPPDPDPDDPTNSFRKIIDNLFGPAGINNVNLQAGAGYLDALSLPGVLTTDFAKFLDNAFKQAVQPGGVTGGVLGARSLQQFFGAYAAYANQALASDSDRFRRRWQAQNRTFIDARLFDGQDPDEPGAFENARAYGSAEACSSSASRVWGGGFGSWARQNSRDNLAGYKYDSQGVALGYEYSTQNISVGFAAAYSDGGLKVKDLRYKNDADVLNLALYGTYIHDSGLYVEGGLGYGHAWNKYRVDSIATTGGVKRGKYGSDSFTADLTLGYVARLPMEFNLVPSVGVEYSFLRNGSWDERVNNASLVANRFGSGRDHGLDIPVGVRFNRMFKFGCDGGFVVPEVRASYAYSANRTRAAIDSGFVGAPGGVVMRGVDPGRSHWRVGGGVSGRINRRVDFRVDYDFEARSGFRGHNLNASVGVSF